MPEEIIKSIIDQARLEHSEAFVDLWFKSLKLIAISDAKAIFLCESNYKKEMLNGKHKGLLRKYTSQAVGFDIEIEVFSQDNIKTNDITYGDASGISEDPDGQISMIDDIPDNADDTANAGDQAGSEDGGYVPLKEDIRKPADKSEHKNEYPDEIAVHDYSKINKSFTFENFIVGSSNKFAYAACYAVANNPANEYNPLFIYGNSGLGKTHLLYAATNLMLQKNPDIKILFVKGDDFTNEMIYSIQTGRNVDFRNKYRKCDVLLVDDIQFIGGKEGTQEEFFHTFNALYEDGKQIIMTSDRPPKEIKTLSDRLRGRFEGGLIADIQPPNLELRVAILKDKCDKMGLEIPIDVLTAIARLLKDNVRQLEGAIKRLGAQNMLTQKPFTEETAMACISDMIVGDPMPVVTPEKILEAVGEKYDVPVADLKSRKRTQKIASARHVAVYLIRKLTNLEYTKIGEIFGRDHSTIMNSYYIVEEELKINSIYEIEINQLINNITKTES